MNAKCYKVNSDYGTHRFGQLPASGMSQQNQSLQEQCGRSSSRPHAVNHQRGTAEGGAVCRAEVHAIDTFTQDPSFDPALWDLGAASHPTATLFCCSYGDVTEHQNH